jgi:peptide/nickel transport system permease protein
VDMLVERIPATLQLAAAGLLLAVVLGVPLGIIAAIRRDSIIDKFAKVFAIIGMSAPQFWIAIMLIMFFGAYLKVLPTFGKGA